MQPKVKTPNQVRGNLTACINYQMCPLCFGCRAFDGRDPNCVECKEDGNDGTKRNFNVCNKDLHTTYAINMMMSRHSIDIDKYKEFHEEIEQWKNNKNY